MTDSAMKKDAVSMSVGSKLRAAREAKGLSRTKLSLVSGVGAASIEKYENDKREPSLENMKRLCQHLAIPFDDFMAEVSGGVTVTPALASDSAGVEDFIKKLDAAGLVIVPKDSVQPKALVEEIGETAQEPAIEGEATYRDWVLLIEEKGVKSRQLKGRAKAFEQTLNDLEYEEIAELAEEVCGLSDVPSDEDLGEMGANAADSASTLLQNRIILNPIYGDVWALKAGVLERYRKEINRMEDNNDIFPLTDDVIEAQGWFREDDKKYQARLKNQVTEHLCRLLIDKKVVVELPSEGKNHDREA